MKKKKHKSSWKRTLASVLELIMVVALTIAGSLAFLHTKSNERKNVFTSTNDIKLYLDELNYNLWENEDGSYKIKDQSKLDPREYVPGMTYPKDPTLYNITGEQTKKSDGKTKELAEEWVAMRVDYAIDDVAKTYADMIADHSGTGTSNTKLGIIEKITFDGTASGTVDDGTEISAPTEFGNWIKLPKSLYGGTSTKYDIYVYKYKLKADAAIMEKTTAAEMETMLKASTADASTATTASFKTSPLFNQIQIKTKEQLEKNGYKIATLNKFAIEVTGAAVKDLATIHLPNGIVAGDIMDGTDINEAKDSGLLVKDLIELLQ